MRKLVFQTDFGVDNLSVSTMYGVSYQVEPRLSISDATHAVKPFDVLNASDCLMYYIPYWPDGTVFVSVVDPGVGTKRRSCVAKLKNGSFVVTPDNGTLTYLKLNFGIEAVREIDESENRYPTTKDIFIFHGRDVYAYCGARLAAGAIDFEGVGPEYPVEEIVEADFIHPQAAAGSVSGMINEATEHFGLMGTNIPFGMLSDNGMNYGDMVRVLIEKDGAEVYKNTVKLERSFGYVALGETFVLRSETSTVMLAKNQGNFVVDNGIGYGPSWKITICKEK